MTSLSHIKDKDFYAKFCEGLSGSFNSKIQCSELYGWRAVYVVYLMASTFFLLLALITINIKNSQQWRGNDHNKLLKFVSSRKQLELTRVN